MRLRNKLLTGLAALVLASGAAKAETYNYSDDFSTDKVRTDSYWNSGILNALPQYGNSPFIIYNGSYLEFFTGYTQYGDAVVCYRLPLNGRVEGVNSGSFCLDIGWNFLRNSGLGHVKISSSADGNNWSTLYEQSDILVPPQIIPIRLNLSNSNGDNQYLMIQGMNIVADNLNVNLESENIVPNEINSWGQIKSLYK